MFFCRMPFRVLYDGNLESSDSNVSNKKAISDIENEIKELNNGSDKLDDEIKDVDNLCTLALSKELSNNLSLVYDLLNAIDEYKKRNGNNLVAKGVNDLEKFLNSIVNYSEFVIGNIDKNNPVGADYKKFEGAINKCSVRIVNIRTMKLNGIDYVIENTLKNFSNVLHNSGRNTDYVKKLQTYLWKAVYASLSSSDSQSFLSSNFINGNINEPNGEFNDAFFLGLNIVLDRIEKRVKYGNSAENINDVKFSKDTSVSIVGFSGAVFYGFDKNIIGNSLDKPRLLDRLGKVKKGEKVGLLEITGKKYIVKLDDKNCLYPIAVDVTSGKIGNSVFLENNTSCIEYLKNKIPSAVNNYCSGVEIGWDGKDYVIGIPGTKRLTIEPLTIANKWLGGASLEDSLAMLIFVNYLRNSGGIDGFEFENDNPDLDWDGDRLLVSIKKNKNAKGESGDKHKAVVDLGRFGLGFLKSDDEIRRKFIRYNNGEHWEDNWDKKKDNKGYGRVDIQSLISAEESKIDSEKEKVKTMHNTNSFEKVTNAESVNPDTISKANYGEFIGSGFISGLDLNRTFDVYESSSNSSINQGKKTYYYQDGNNIIRLAPPYIVKERATDKTIRDSKLPDDAKFSPDNTLNICEQGKKALENQLESVYQHITRKELDLTCDLKQNDGCYTIKWSKDNDNYEININNVIIGKDGKIFGYVVNKPEDWLKVVCGAVKYYDKISSVNVGSELNVSADEAALYGIDDNNKDSVALWLNSLIPDNANGEKKISLNIKKSLS